MDSHKVVGLGALLECRLVVRQGMWIGFGPADLVRDRIGIVCQVDARLVRGIRFRHFLQTVTQRHHPRRRPLNQRLGLGKERLPITVCMDGFCEIIVEFLRDIAREL